MKWSRKMPHIYKLINYLSVHCMSIVLIFSLLSQNVCPYESIYVDCPIKLEPNGSGYCQCNDLLEIRCFNLNDIPEFLEDDTVYTAIYLQNQNISSVLQGVFLNLKVAKLQLDFNPIGDKISVNAFQGLEDTMVELHMSGCGIKSLPDKMLNDMANLKEVHLWGNEIESLPPTLFRRSMNLEELQLWGNNIGQLDKNAFAGMWNLKKLDMDKNALSTLERDTFRHLSNLESFHVGENNISYLYGRTFEYMTGLKMLNLDNNGLQIVYKDCFVGLGNLLSLSLQDNKLTYLSENIFDDLPSLVNLNLGNNFIEFIWVKTFDMLRGLQHLDMSYNMFTDLPDNLFKKNKKLVQLNIDNNKLPTMRACSLPHKGRVKLQLLSLVGNPLSCDCRIAWLPVLREKGVSIWGTCAHTPAHTLTSLVDPVNYELCKQEPIECAET